MGTRALCVAFAVGLAALVSFPAAAQATKPDIIGMIPADADGAQRFVCDLSSDGHQLLLHFSSLRPGADRLVLFDVPTGKAIHDFTREGWRTTSATLSRSTKVLLVHQQSKYGIVQLNAIDVASGKMLFQYGQDFGGLTGAVSPDDQLLVFSTPIDRKFQEAQTHIRCIRLSGLHQVWDISLGKSEDTSPRLIWSPDGKRLYVGTHVLEQDELLNAADGSVIAKTPDTYKDYVTEARFSKDGGTLAVLHFNGLYETLAAADGKKLASIPTKSHPLVYQPISPDLKWLIAPGRAEIVWTPLFEGGASARLSTGPRPFSMANPSSDGQFAIIDADHDGCGDLTVIRLPDAKDLPRDAPPTMPQVHDPAARPPRTPAPQGTAQDWKNPGWWCDRADAEVDLLESDLDRAHCEWRLCAIRAHLGDLTAAARLLAAADALHQPPTVPADWRANEKLVAYYWLARQTARTKTLAEAKALLEQLSAADRSNADWMPAAALATGRAEAGDVEAVRRLIEPLRGEQRTEVASRAVRVLVAGGRADDAAGIVELMPSGVQKAFDLRRVLQAKVRAGDFQFALNTLDTFPKYSPRDQLVGRAPVEYIAMRAVETGHPEVIDQLRAHQTPTAASDIDSGIVLGYLAAGQTQKAMSAIQSLESRLQPPLRQLVEQRYIKAGDLEDVFALHHNDSDCSWAGLTLGLLLQAGKVDAAVDFIQDARLASMDQGNRSTLARRVAEALLTAGRLDEADKLLARFPSDATAADVNLQALRAGALRQAGRVHEARILTGYVVCQVKKDPHVPAPLREVALATVAYNARDFDLLAEVLKGASGKNSFLRSGYLMESATTVAIDSGDEALDKLLPFFGEIERDWQPFPRGFMYWSIAQKVVVEKSRGGEYAHFMNRLPAPLSRCRAALAAAEILLPPDPTDDEYPMWNGGE